jgi:pilus assembly protein Flp/PilA
MRKHVVDMIKRFARDERGASLLEYTVLIGIITVGAIASITSVGSWVGIKWTALVTNLGAGGAVQ